MSGRSVGVALLGAAVTALLTASYALGEWPLWVRVAAEVAAAGVLGGGLLLLWPRKWAANELQSAELLGQQGAINRAPTSVMGQQTWWATMLTGWGMVLLALCSGAPSAVAGGLLLSAPMLMLTLVSSSHPSFRQPAPNLLPPPFRGRAGVGVWLLLPLPPGVGSIGLWLYLHAAIARGEWLYAALMLAGIAGLRYGLLRLRPRLGWLGKLFALISIVGFAAVSLLVDNGLRPLLTALPGLPAWAALRVQRLDLPDPQPDAAVGFALQQGGDTAVLPILALVISLGFALALVWLLYRLAELLVWVAMKLR